MLAADAVRLEILKMLLPVASRLGIESPEKIIEKARTFENYVLESDEQAGVTPDPADRRKPGRPRKEKPDQPVPEFLTPPVVDKSNQTPG